MEEYKIMVSGKERTMEEVLANEQREIIKKLWGTESTPFKPFLLDKRFGDGLQLVYFGTLDDRPYHWLALVDSSTDIEDIDPEDIYQAIEDECGTYEDAMENALQAACHVIKERMSE